MDTAWKWAEQSTCSRMAVGAVLVWGGRAFAQGYNGAPRGLPHCSHPVTEPCDWAIHAEENAIINAGFHGATTQDSILFTTHAPCQRCAGRIINAGIVAVVYEMDYRDPTGLDMLNRVGMEVTKIA